jgi:hypothetical protein
MISVFYTGCGSAIRCTTRAERTMRYLAHRRRPCVLTRLSAPRHEGDQQPPSEGSAPSVIASSDNAYHLLTGAALFPHSNPAVVIGRHLNTPPPALSDTRSELAAPDPVLAVALAKDPADRFARCGDFARGLAEQMATGGAPTPTAPTTPAPISRPTASTSPPAAAAPEPADKHSRGRRREILRLPPTQPQRHVDFGPPIPHGRRS